MRTCQQGLNLQMDPSLMKGCDTVAPLPPLVHPKPYPIGLSEKQPILGIKLLIPAMGQAVKSAHCQERPRFMPNAAVRPTTRTCHDVTFQIPKWSVDASRVDAAHT